MHDVNTVFTEPSPSTNVSENLKGTWERHVKQGNVAFDDGDLDFAESCYREALSIAQYLIDTGNVDRACISMLLVSHHNSADVYLQQNNPEEALKRLSAALGALLDCSASHSTCLEKCEALEWGAIRAKRQLSLFLQSHPDMHQPQFDYLTSQCVNNQHH